MKCSVLYQLTIILGRYIANVFLRTDSVISFIMRCIVSYEVTILGRYTANVLRSFFHGMHCHISLK